MSHDIETFSGIEDLTIDPRNIIFLKKDELGSGGYGTVYRATDNGTTYDNSVVVKKIRLQILKREYLIM